MSYLLQCPTTVLLVGDDDLPDDVRAGILSGSATTIDAVPTVEKCRRAVAERDDVGCVLLADPGDDRSPGTACDALHEEAPDVPVIVRLDDDEVVAAELASRVHCRYLPGDASPSAVRAAVDDALEAHDRRRRRTAESSLFRTLLDEADVPIFAKDDQARHLYKSGLTSDQSHSEVIGRTDVEMAAPNNAEGARRAYEDDVELLETGQGVYGQEERGGRGNDEYWSLVTKVPWRDDDGDVQGLVGLAFDITWWKERERQLEAQQRRVDQFASYLRHDLRTPLQVATGALELAREGDEEAFEKIERAHERMMQVVDDLSSLSGGGPPTSQLSDEMYDAVGLGIKSVYLASMIEDLWAVYGPSEGELSIELPADTLIVAQSDTVRPLAENLLKNAIEHGGSDVTVRVGTTGHGGFFIEDDGPGMPPELAAAVSERNIEATARMSGTGLLIVLDAIQELGWDVTVAEAEGGGTRVEIGECSIVTGAPADVEPTDAVEISSTADVGDPDLPGSATYDPDADRWYVTGAGANVWGDTNEFQFAYGTASAPARIEGRIDRLDNVHEFSKAGLAIRAGLSEDAPFGYVGTTGSHGSEVTFRFTTDGHTDSDQFEERPLAFQWYRVDYVDGEVTCYLSENGTEWHAVDQQSIDLGEEVLLGMMVCSHDAERTCEATFRNVRAWELDVL